MTAPSIRLPRRPPLSQHLELGWPLASGWGAVALLALGWHAMRIVICMVQFFRRNEALEADIAQRPDPSVAMNGSRPSRAMSHILRRGCGAM